MSEIENLWHFFNGQVQERVLSLTTWLVENNWPFNGYHGDDSAQNDSEFDSPGLNYSPECHDDDDDGLKVMKAGTFVESNKTEKETRGTSKTKPR